MTDEWRLRLRFIAVGLLNTAFGYAMFAVLIRLGVPAGPALVVATLLGIAFNFQTSRRLVFRAHGRWLRFLAVYGFVLAVNWALLRAARAEGIGPLWAQAALVLPLAALSFLGQRLFVFNAPGGDQERAE